MPVTNWVVGEKTKRAGRNWDGRGGKEKKHMVTEHVPSKSGVPAASPHLRPSLEQRAAKSGATKRSGGGGERGGCDGRMRTRTRRPASSRGTGGLTNCS